MLLHPRRSRCEQRQTSGNSRQGVRPLSLSTSSSLAWRTGDPSQSELKPCQAVPAVGAKFPNKRRDHSAATRQELESLLTTCGLLPHQVPQSRWLSAPAGDCHLASEYCGGRCRTPSDPFPFPLPVPLIAPASATFLDTTDIDPSPVPPYSSTCTHAHTRARGVEGAVGVISFARGRRWMTRLSRCVR